MVGGYCGNPNMLTRHTQRITGVYLEGSKEQFQIDRAYTYSENMKTHVQ